MQITLCSTWSKQCVIIKWINSKNSIVLFDALLVDDIQLCRKKKHKKNFFHIFNNLFETGRQIILTSDRYPKEIEKIEERPKISLRLGVLTTAIEPPDLGKTRVAIS